jgi:hypothetical protein
MLDLDNRSIKLASAVLDLPVLRLQAPSHWSSSISAGYESTFHG